MLRVSNDGAERKVMATWPPVAVDLPAVIRTECGRHASGSRTARVVKEIASSSTQGRCSEVAGLFVDVFRLDHADTLSVSLGAFFEKSSDGFHPYNLAAGKALWGALQNALGISEKKIVSQYGFFSLFFLGFVCNILNNSGTRPQALKIEATA